MEETVFFESNSLSIEGLFAEGTGRDAAVIAHPHPSYGGDMFNPVVAAVARSYRRAGYATLRFNFRGVGRSRGSFSDGVGEQEDLLAAAAFLRARDLKVTALAGYSFGAWVIAMAAAAGHTQAELVLVSPPVAFIDFGAIERLPDVKLVVVGSRDDFAPAAKVREMVSLWNPNAALEVVDNADHFYGGFSEPLEICLEKHIHSL